MMILYFLLEILVGAFLLTIVVCRANEMERSAKLPYKVAYIGISFGSVWLLKSGVIGHAIDWPMLLALACVGLLLLTTRLRWRNGMPEDVRTSGRLLDDLRELVRGP